MNNPQIEIQSDKSALPLEVQAAVSLLVNLTVPDVSATGPQEAGSSAGVNLALVLDRSGSMNSRGRMRAAKAAAHQLIDELRPMDLISVVSFSCRAELLATGVAGDQKQLLHDLIDSVEVGGQTDLHAGWLLGAEQVAAHYRVGHLNRVVLLSDGMANRGVRGQAAITGHVATLSRTGVSTTALGVGKDFHEELLEAMAEAGDGNYYYAPEAEALPGLFQEELREQRLVYGSRAQLRVLQRARGVRVLSQLNQLKEEQPGCYQLGNLVMSKSQRVVFEVIVPPDLPLNEPLLTFELEWRDVAGEAHAVSCEWKMPRVAEAVYLKLPVQAAVELERSLLLATWNKRQAAEALDRGHHAVAMQLFEKALLELESVADEAAAQRMMESVLRLREQARAGEVAHSSKQAKYESSRHRRKSEG
jgi:Ca-activated chloride channel family protein